MNTDDVYTRIQSLKIPGGELMPETVQEICGMIERGEMTLKEVREIIGSVGHIHILSRQITPDVFQEVMRMVQYIKEIDKSEPYQGNA